MPQIGDTQSARSLGYRQSCTYIWLACKQCGEERWVRRKEAIKPSFRNLCRICSAKAIQAQVARKARLEGYPFKYARELGLGGRLYYYWLPCPVCGEGKWRQKSSLKEPCIKCTHKMQGGKIRADKNGNWKGGRWIDKNGYTWVTLSPNSLYTAMARKAQHCNSYVIQEHRLIMAQHLGRCLESWEIVHHINGIKSDNRIENLSLLPNAREHTPYTRMEARIKQLEGRVTLLEAENELLKNQTRDSIPSIEGGKG